MDPHEPRRSAIGTIERQAVVWLARRDRGLTGAEQDDFLQWLAADPRHGEWFARHQQTMAGLKLLAQWRPEHGAQPNPDLLAQPKRGRRWLMLTALAAAAALTVDVYHWFYPAPAARPVAGASAFEQRLLEDGSLVEQNRGAAFDVQFTPRERRVRLMAGEAHFIVAKNSLRPFVVQAGQVSVRAVGTAFDVRFEAREVAVLVTEGKVQVGSDGTGASHSALFRGAAQSPPVPITVAAGQLTVVSLGSSHSPPHVVQVSSEEIAKLLSWQPRQLEFESTPLSQVVAEFNRHNRLQIVIGDPTIAYLPIGASFRSDNIDGFVRLMEAGFGIEAERHDTEVILRKAR